MIRIDLQGGKYTYIFNGGESEARRHGEFWRDCTGDNLLLAMAQRIEHLEELVKELEEKENF